MLVDYPRIEIPALLRPWITKALKTDHSTRWSTGPTSKETGSSASHRTTRNARYDAKTTNFER